jgi:hypothetical protein
MGKRSSFLLCLFLLNCHGLALTIFCPHDFAASLTSPDLTEELEWISTPLFTVASSHAISAARLVCAASKLDDPADASWPVPGLFPNMVLRAAWVRALCLWKVSGDRTHAAGLFGTEQGTDDEREYVDRAVQDLADSVELIDRQGRTSLPPDLFSGYMEMVKDVVVRLASGEPVPEDEAELVRMVRNIRI